MKTLLALIFFVLLFGSLGVAALLGFALWDWPDVVLLVLVYVFRREIKAGVERLTGANNAE